MKKRWFIAIIILVVIAVVLAIVFINLFKTRTTKGFAEHFNTYVTTGYLAQDKEQYGTIDAYLAALSTNEELSENEQNTILNERASLHAYAITGQFFNRHIIFMKVTEVFQKQKGKIESSLKKAQNAADDLEKYINKNMDKSMVGGVVYWEAETYSDTKGFLADIFNFTTDAVNRLADVYVDCMPVANKNKDIAILNNDYAKLIFKQTKTLTENVSSKIGENASYGAILEKFCNSYYSKQGEELLASYPYNENLQNIVKDINTLGEESHFFAQFIDGNIAG